MGLEQGGGEEHTVKNGPTTAAQACEAQGPGQAATRTSWNLGFKKSTCASFKVVHDAMNAQDHHMSNVWRMTTSVGDQPHLIVGEGIAGALLESADGLVGCALYICRGVETLSATRPREYIC
jgi:hypothetical protein